MLSNYAVISGSNLKHIIIFELALKSDLQLHHLAEKIINARPTTSGRLLLPTSVLYIYL